MQDKSRTRGTRAAAPAVLALVLLSLAIALSQLDGVEREALEAFRGLSTGWLTAFMLAVTELGSTAVVTALAVAWVLAQPRGARREALLPAMTAAGAGLTSLLVKLLVQRPRPDVVEALVQVDSFSFPSGHSLLSMAFYGALALCVIPRIRHGLARIGVAVFAGLLVLLIGASRVYLGVHYPSDVLAGFGLGAAWLGALGSRSWACRQAWPHEGLGRSQRDGLPWPPTACRMPPVPPGYADDA